MTYIKTYTHKRRPMHCLQNPGQNKMKKIYKYDLMYVSHNYNEPSLN